MDIKERNKLIKKRLVKVFNAKDVRVRGDVGTAYGWVKIKVEQDRPEGCACNWQTHSYTYNGITHTSIQRGPLNDQVNRSTYMCEKCLGLHEKTIDIVRKTIFTKDIEYYHYTSDDGYGTERAEVLYDVSIR